MTQPRRSQPPSVYWRRRLVVASVAVLIIVTLVFLLADGFGSSGDTDQARSGGPGSGRPQPTAGTSAVGTAGSSGGLSPAPSNATSPIPATASVLGGASATTTTTTPTAGAAVPDCSLEVLAVTATTPAPAFPTGAAIALDLIVTNTGAGPCVADLSDSQIELRVFSGAARIWGSHDCQIEPGTSRQTLPVNQPVQREVVWSGLSANEGCTAVRQRVGAGSYTLIPIFAGKAGTPSTFTIT